MMPDATYLSDPALAPAFHLLRAGQWDLALTFVKDHSDLRAEILADRFIWQQTGADEAIEAAQMASEPWRDLILARISYWHKLMKYDNPLEIDELAVFQAADGGWPAFWSGVVLDNVHERPEEAAKAYARARDLMAGDLFLESYVVRHESFHLLETDPERSAALARRSLAIRASLGARPQTAAAQAALARSLPVDDPEAAELMEIVYTTAEELNLGWLKRS